MSEFSLSIGNVGRGIVSSVFAAVKYILIPILVLTALTELFAQIQGATALADQLDLDRIRLFAIVLGIPITMLAFFRGFYPKGTRSRFVFGAGVSVLVCIWTWTMMMGGHITLEMEEVGFTLSYVGFVLLFILAAALGGVYCLVEMISYRKEWLASEDGREVHPVHDVA
ncbi:MAG: hypothetical protein SA339_04800 [Methanomassiliicoccus sp.]|nr:hypothetical protein [Methanomassiliicoccus sp.]